MRRRPAPAGARNSPPPNDSRAAGERRVRRDRPKGLARAAKPFQSAKPDRFDKSAKSDKIAKAPSFDRRDKPVRFDRRDKPANFVKPAKFGTASKFARFAKPDTFAERAALAPTGPALRLTSNIYIAHTQPGFEGVAAEEIASRYAAASADAAAAVPRCASWGGGRCPSAPG